MPASKSYPQKTGKSYEDFSLTREDCLSIIECNPHHIRFLPSRWIDNGLAVAAIRGGALPEEIPVF